MSKLESITAAQSFLTNNPAQGQKLTEYFYMTWEETEKKLKAAQGAYKNVAHKSSLEQRMVWVSNIHSALAAQKHEIAHLITLEMGKPVKESIAEVEKCMTLCEVFMDKCKSWLAPKAEGDLYKILRHPYGVSLGIMPWNFPYWQVFRYSIPALLSGNAVLLKHSEQVMGNAQMLEKIFQQSLPDKNLFQNLIIDHKTAEKVMQSPWVNIVSFTGSTKAGQKIAATCGASLKKCVLELGGNDAYVVAETADMGVAAKACAASRLVNNGQSCVAAKRFLIHQDVFEKFLSLFIAEFQKFAVGHPQEKQTDLGPLSAERFVEQLRTQCSELESLGFEKRFQATETVFIKDSKGSYFLPRIYVGKDSTRFFDQEIFGPVALCYSYSKWEQVEHFVMDSQYGLGCALFSQKQSEIERFQEVAEAGFIGINDSVKSSAVVPFGGFKQSGFGRELGEAGFLEFSQTKTVLLKS